MRPPVGARLRRIELDGPAHAIRIVLFDDTAGTTLSAGAACADALRVLRGDLRVLERIGGFATYDPQADRLLGLAADFEAVRRLACGGPCNDARKRVAIGVGIIRLAPAPRPT